MDMITLAMAKAYSDSKGGYVKPGEVIAFDGNTNGKEIFADTDMGLSLVKVSDKFYDLSKVNRIVATDTATGEKLDIQFSAFTENGESLAGGFAGETYVISTDGTGDNVGFLTPGTWVFLEKGINISRIEFAETIVPIDPKYLPGVCLPVVEITSAYYPSEGVVELSAQESAQLDKALEMDVPCVIKGQLDNGAHTTFSVICHAINGAGFVATLPVLDATIMVVKTSDTVWSMGNLE